MGKVAGSCTLLVSAFIGSAVALGWADEERLLALPTDEWAIVETTLTCEEANRTAHRAVERLGYQVTAFTPATNEKLGEVKGSRTSLWGETEPVSVKITCKPDGIDVDARPEIPPCEQANRISRLAIQNLGYEVTKYTPAAIGKPGIVRGEQPGQEPAVITLFCDGRMVTMETRTDSPLLKKKDFFLALSDFRRGFYAMFKGQRSVVEPQPASTSSDQLQVVMKPLTKAETQIVFGAEVVQVVPVRVEVSNSTKHPYLLEAEKIVLVSISGERVKPVSDNGNAFPTPALLNQPLAPGANVKGYLYYPPGTYTGARGSFVEEKSQERQGFELPFK